MAAEPVTTPAPAARIARSRERAPSGGWRTIAAKELSDHLQSVRFIVLLIVIAIAAIVPMYFVSTAITANAPELAGQPALFLVLFIGASQQAGGIPAVEFAALFIPLVGIAFGFDAINSERSQGTLSRLLAQPIHRDDVVNGKFAAGIAVIAMMMTALVVLITALGIVRLGIIPSVEELARVIVWLLTTILYAGLWLAFALLLSVAIRGAASAALVGFGTWLGLTLFGTFLLPLAANALFPASTTGTGDQYFAATTAQQLFLRISPPQLYQDVVTAVLNPSARGMLGPANLGQYVSGQQQIPSLLTLDQSILLVWPQLVALVALTVVTFALAYVLFLRQEVRA